MFIVQLNTWAIFGPIFELSQIDSKLCLRLSAMGVNSSAEKPENLISLLNLINQFIVVWMHGWANIFACAWCDEHIYKCIGVKTVWNRLWIRSIFSMWPFPFFVWVQIIYWSLNIGGLSWPSKNGFVWEKRLRSICNTKSSMNKGTNQYWKYQKSYWPFSAPLIAGLFSVCFSTFPMLIHSLAQYQRLDLVFFALSLSALSGNQTF